MLTSRLAMDNIPPFWTTCRVNRAIVRQKPFDICDPLHLFYCDISPLHVHHSSLCSSYCFQDSRTIVSCCILARIEVCALWPPAWRGPTGRTMQNINYRKQHWSVYTKLFMCMVATKIVCTSHYLVFLAQTFWFLRY